ncbi:MAG: hypothetical protein QF551_02965 [Candidatus Marinimicrobia bacterium]|jgi:nicotinate-nucleotide pyrophosphorylase|nr:hypothetical protein [Candidatus Neomarinimicrobiota bacterium]MDP6966218.1 hypothetical protein [Candidatus Neomarinimicrobiota bacterium]|tara:strand:+ start:6041 stop:6928 length:888 start_codon:yes stop_codon:yes gene_type:complete
MSDSLNKAIAQALCLYDRKIGEGDLTMETLLSYPPHVVVNIRNTKPVPACILPLFEQVVKYGDPSLQFETDAATETVIPRGDITIHLEGNGSAILTGWQVARPLVSLMARVFAKVRAAVETVEPYGIKVGHNLDLPTGYGKIIAHAVEEAGGMTLDTGLNERVYITSDHLKSVGSLNKAVAKVIGEVGDQRSLIKIVVEVRSADELAQLTDKKVDWVYCRGFSADEIKEGGKLTKGWVRMMVDDSIGVKEVVALKDAGVKCYAVGVNELFAVEDFFTVEFEREQVELKQENSVAV